MSESTLTLVSLSDADRKIVQRPTQDGDGVKISRIAGSHYNEVLDPFLLIDEINSDDSKDYVGGFPPHPHRGFQTFTYMLDGSFQHKDSMGNSGRVSAGGVQWMSAAGGVIHSEMPEPDGEKLHGFQLWINLPAQEKMNDPQYRDIQAGEIPAVRFENKATVHGLAGHLEVDGTLIEGALPLAKGKATVMSFELFEGAELTLDIPAGHNLNIIVFEGGLNNLSRGELAHFSPRDEDYGLRVRSSGDGARFLVLLGKPISEPIAQYGPFVMNTMAEIEQAMQDYRDGSLVKVTA